ncbi:hypothetical protein [Streptomyces cylindrosporus]|uniref:Uncharacterized protein n=1 Tax=Streptomyces cylindrosporus TaxID=2927583 RepID=A0ABS9Y5T5_9ACTN|nr:hypothetical protein [Streptomyces cylindrosporus]MCI3272559.1 hypothetical protein [Streptomyces cylindrosporus]
MSEAIANPMLGVVAVEAHKVTAVIVTHTDHEFVDLAIKATADSTAKQSVKAGAKALAKKVARKAAFGLAASLGIRRTPPPDAGPGPYPDPDFELASAYPEVTWLRQPRPPPTGPPSGSVFGGGDPETGTGEWIALAGFLRAVTGPPTWPVVRIVRRTRRM